MLIFGPPRGGGGKSKGPKLSFLGRLRWQSRSYSSGNGVLKRPKNLDVLGIKKIMTELKLQIPVFFSSKIDVRLHEHEILSMR